jgi:signal transduction histidine kinase
VEANEQNTEFFTDAERLKQVLSKLLNNAAKYTNQGSIRFGFKLIDQSNIFFYVRDTGMGIPEDMKERIFERFFQLDKHQSQKIGGSGLGLAICKNIIQLLGGKIWVESIEGKGSDFFFQLPYRKTTKSSIDQAKNYTVSDRIPDWSTDTFYCRR